MKEQHFLQRVSSKKNICSALSNQGQVTKLNREGKGEKPSIYITRIYSTSMQRNEKCYIRRIQGKINRKVDNNKKIKGT